MRMTLCPPSAMNENWIEKLVDTTHFRYKIQESFRCQMMSHVNRMTVQFVISF